MGPNDRWHPFHPCLPLLFHRGAYQSQKCLCSAGAGPRMQSEDYYSLGVTSILAEQLQIL